MAHDLLQVPDHGPAAGDEHLAPEIDRSVGCQLVETGLSVSGEQVHVGPAVQRLDRGPEHLRPRECAQVRRVVLWPQRWEHPFERAIHPGDTARLLFETQIQEIERRGAPAHDDDVLPRELRSVAQR